jgi:hypothetical protein
MFSFPDAEGSLKHSRILPARAHQPQNKGGSLEELSRCKPSGFASIATPSDIQLAKLAICLNIAQYTVA